MWHIASSIIWTTAWAQPNEQYLNRCKLNREISSMKRDESMAGDFREVDITNALLAVPATTYLVLSRVLQ